MNQSKEHLRETILSLLTPKLEKNNLDPQSIEDTFDFFESGIMDSFGFLDFISELEERLGHEISFMEWDPEAFSTIGGLVECMGQDSLNS